MVDVHTIRFEVLPGTEIWRVMNSWAVLRQVLPELKYREVMESQPLFVLPVTDLETWRTCNSFQQVFSSIFIIYF